jgi:uncharacterized protein
MLDLDLKLKDISEDGQDLRVPYPADVLSEALDGAEVQQSHVEARLHLQRFNETVNVHGSLEGDVKLPCARCLGEAHLSVHVPLRIIVGPESLGGEDSLEDETEYFTHDGETVHLGAMLREALILAVPMTTVCREDCKGLCAVCGGNKNENDCGHTQSLPDPRFAALKDLKL